MARASGFYPTKNLGAYGDAGMSFRIHWNLRAYSNAAQPWPDGEVLQLRAGLEQPLDELQAAILRVKLRHLSNWQHARQANAGEYTRLLNQSPA